MIYVENYNGRSKVHIQYHVSRFTPGVVVANCGHSIYFAIKVREDELDPDRVCKKCKRGPTPFVQKTFEGVRIP